MTSSTYATERQLAYINDLMENRVLTDEQRAKAAEQIREGLSKDLASRWIDRLLLLPKVEITKGGNENFPDVPAGRYAIEYDNGDVRFYRIDKPTEGRWSGYTFVNVQAGDELHPVRNPDTRKMILETISAFDPEAASKRYGLLLGHCGVCGRTLTNDLSREIGIGPVCRDKMGW